MVSSAVLCLGVALILGVAEAAVEGVQAVDDNILNNDLPEPDTTGPSLRQQCSSKLTPPCLKLSLVDLLARRSGSGLEVVPGLTVRGDPTALELTPDVTSGQLDAALVRYLSSLSLSVQLVDSAVAGRMRELGKALSQQAVSGAITGRKKLGGGGSWMMAGLMSGGSMMALMMSAIAMMAGKALMTAMMSLMLSAMSMTKGNGGGGGKTTYEVVHASHGHDVHRSIQVAEAGVVYPSRRNSFIPLHLR